MTAMNTPTAGMRGEIQTQWSKFTYEEVSALKTKDDLVASCRRSTRSTGRRLKKMSMRSQGSPARSTNQ